MGDPLGMQGLAASPRASAEARQDGPYTSPANRHHARCVFNLSAPRELASPEGARDARGPSEAPWHQLALLQGSDPTPCHPSAPGAPAPAFSCPPSAPGGQCQTCTSTHPTCHPGQVPAGCPCHLAGGFPFGSLAESRRLLPAAFDFSPTPFFMLPSPASPFLTFLPPFSSPPRLHYTLPLPPPPSLSPISVWFLLSVCVAEGRAPITSYLERESCSQSGLRLLLGQVISELQ